MQQAHLKSKNHYADCEDFDAGGVIPNIFISTGEYPCNPSDILEAFLGMRPATTQGWLLLKPIPDGAKWDIAGVRNPGIKKFNLHCPDTIIVFEKTKAGCHKIRDMCPMLSEALGVGRCTNGQVNLDAQLSASK